MPYIKLKESDAAIRRVTSHLKGRKRAGPGFIIQFRGEYDGGEFEQDELDYDKCCDSRYLYLFTLLTYAKLRMDS